MQFIKQGVSWPALAKSHAIAWIKFSQLMNLVSPHLDEMLQLQIHCSQTFQGESREILPNMTTYGRGNS